MGGETELSQIKTDLSPQKAGIEAHKRRFEGLGKGRLEIVERFGSVAGQTVVRRTAAFFYLI